VPTKFEPLVVPSFGGGLNYLGHPSAIRADEWSDSDGWLARRGYAEVLPGFVQVISGAAGWGHAADYRCIGLVQNPYLFGPDVGAHVGFVHDVNSDGLLYDLTGDLPGGPFTQVTPTLDTAGGVAPLMGHPQAVLQLAYLNGATLFCMGMPRIGGFNSVARRTSAVATTYQTLVPPGIPFGPMYLGNLGGHLVAAQLGPLVNQWRLIRVSDQGLETDWVPAVANSADAFEIDTASGTVGMIPLGPEKMVLLFRDAVYKLSPTGGFPPFTASLVGRPGGYDDHRGPTIFVGVAGQQCGAGPYGVVYRTFGNFHVLEQGPIANKLGDLILDSDRRNPDTQDALPRPYPWDDAREVSWLGMPPRAGGAVGEVFAYNPADQSLSRRTLPTSGERLQVIRGGSQLAGSPGGAQMTCRLWVASRAGTLHTEAFDPAVGHVNAYIDSKDFSSGDPPRRIYYGRIKVDWETLSGPPDDTLVVQAWARDEMQPRGTIVDGSGRSLAGPFVTLGTLTAGQAELPVRFAAKHTRLRFVSPSGRKRIRGFTLHVRGWGNRTVAP
jgi:hypothetical protein